MDTIADKNERRRRRRRVADEDRKRAHRACERCKRRKNRCIETPTGECQRCSEGAHHCVFAQEKSLLDGRDGGDQAMDSPDHEVVGQSSPNSMLADQTPQSIQSVQSTQSTQSTHTIQQHAMAIDGTLASSDSFMWSSFLSRLREAFCLDSQSVPEEGGMRHQATPGLASGSTTPSPAEYRRLQVAIASFPPRDIGMFLVTVSNKHGTDSFFYVDQGQFSVELGHFYDNPSSRLRHDASFVCLALSIFALGSQWTTLVRPETRRSVVSTDESDPGRIFYNHARAIMGDILDSTSIRSVQAAYVLAIYLLPASAIRAAYVYMGLALRKAQALEFHQDNSDPSVGERDREIRRRLWWAIYSLERTLTIKLNRPSSVRQEVITNPLPRPFEAIDSTQTFQNLQYQIANAKLVLILDRLTETRNWTESQADKYNAELKDWKRSLPPSIRIQNLHPKSSGYRAAVHLYLNYYLAWISMGKVAVVTVVRAYLYSAFRPNEEVSEIDSTVERLSRSCIKSAKKTLQLFERLTHTRNLTRFSFTDFQGCSLATTILLVAGIVDKEGDCNVQAGLGLSCLRRMTGGNSTAKMGVRFVEALQSIAHEAAARLKASQADPNTSASSPGLDNPSEYNRWAEWLSTAGTMDVEDQAIERPVTPTGLASVALPQSSRSIYSTSSQAPELVSAASEWERVAAIQLAQLSTSSYPPLVDIPSWPSDSMGQHESLLLAPEFQSSFDGDDHAYLMGLTGLDMLNLPDQFD